jgi:hypothetical protein
MELAQAVADVDSDKGSDAHRPPPKCRAVSPSLRCAGPRCRSIHAASYAAFAEKEVSTRQEPRSAAWCSAAQPFTSLASAPSHPTRLRPTNGLPRCCIIRKARKAGATSLRAIAQVLNDRGIPTRSVTNGKNQMPPWGDLLKGDDIEALWAYVTMGEKK